MKKEIRRIALVFAVIFTFMAVSFCLVSCGDGGADSTTKNPVLPTLTTGGDATTGGTTSANTTTTNNVVPGTSGTTTTPVTPPTGEYVNPLTGLKTTYDASQKRPVAIVVDNIGLALAHQTGLNQADILYETLVAPGITRFLMVVSNYTNLSNVCNVRSARIFHIDLAANHNAILVCHGGSTYEAFATVASMRLGGAWNEELGKNTYGYINTKDEYAFGTQEGGLKYGTIKYYTGAYNSGRVDLKYDTLVTAGALIATLQSNTSRFRLSGNSVDGLTKQSLKFAAAGTESAVMNGASTATNVILNFTMDNFEGDKNVSYMLKNGKYYRYQNGTAHTDSVTGEQLCFTNLVTLFTDVTRVQGTIEDPNVASVRTTGSGSGYYFYNGKCIPINWSKLTGDSALVLTTITGAELTLATGNTYIAYLDNTNTSSAVIYN
ncbi:MAG: DUF3048 domain-containing protein [Clostridia bacterium]|nr:DUF3048 domain-containing protein [Clostridia bacterium]